MSRVIAVLACGIALAACSMSMPSFDFLKSSPTTEVLRVESEPPGAEAKTTQGQSCKTPCELTLPAGGETAISFALNGYQPQTVQVRADAGAGAARLQPNPVYAELAPVKAPAKQKPTPKRTKKTTTASPVASGSTATAETSAPTTSGYPWPDSQPR